MRDHRLPRNMLIFSSLAVLLLCGTFDLTSGSTLKPFQDMNMEEALKYLYEKVSLLENREASDLAQKIKAEIKDELASKLAEMDNDLSTKLEQRMSTQKESLDEMVSERLLKEKNERLSMDNHILMEVHQLQRRALESVEKINNVKSEIASVSEGGRNRTGMLEVKIKENGDLIHSCLASQRNTEEAIWKNMSSSLETLRTNVSEDLTSRIADIQSNVASKIGNLENLANHSSSLLSLSTRLTRLENRCSDPPHVESGHPISGGSEGRDHGDVVTYACRGDKVTAGNHRMECLFGKWTGELPRCVDPVCDPPCRNGGVCKKYNTCSCAPAFSGDRCQNAVCDPPCQNGGVCKINNTCSCSSPAFRGNRCQNVQCGLDLRSVGVNGSGMVGGNTGTSTPDWPWLTAVYSKGGKDSPPVFRCPGSIIHRQFILTAARCMYDWSVGGWNRLNGTDLTVRLGLTNRSDFTHLQELNVRTIYVHPLFDIGKYWDYNVALLKLEKPMDYNLSVRPVCLPPQETPGDNRSYEPQSTVHAVRWLDGTQTERHLVVQPRDICSNAFGGRFTDRMFCVARDSCRYLPGSPALQSHPNAEGARVWTQVGVGTFYCVRHGGEMYAAFSRLQALMPWLHRSLAG